MLASCAKMLCKSTWHAKVKEGQERLLRSRKSHSNAVDGQSIAAFRKAIGCFMYAAVGDAIGFRSGQWEFEKSSSLIIHQSQQLGGIEGILNEFQHRPWPVSDDTVMHLATGLAALCAIDPDIAKNVQGVHDVAFAAGYHSVFRLELEAAKPIYGDKRPTLPWCADQFGHFCDMLYTDSMNAMSGRYPGIQVQNAITLGLNSKKYPIQYSQKAGGNGAAMRSMCLGLSCVATTKEIVERAIVCAKCTHPNFTGILGACMSAIFTNYAFNNFAPCEWPKKFFEEAYPAALSQLQRLGPDWSSAKATDSNYFLEQWKKYMSLRFCNGQVNFPRGWEKDFAMRQEFFDQFAYSGWNGSSGHDALIMAYDAFLYSHSDVRQLYSLSALHGGDSDSTASIAGAFYGAYNGTTTRLNLNGTL